MSIALFSQTTAHIYDAVLDERHRAAALRAIAEYVGAAGAGYILLDKDTGIACAAASWGCFTGSMADYLSYYARVDPLQSMRATTVCGSWFRATEVLSAAILSHDEWYNDYLIPGGVSDILAIKLYENASRAVFTGIHRPVGDANPFPCDPAALYALIDPLCRAARLQLSLGEIGYQSAIVRGALDRLAAGLIFAERDGRIIEMNVSGEAILSLDDGLTAHSGQLCARRNFESVKLSSLIAAAASGTEPSAGCMLIARDGGKPPYTIRVVPVGVALGAFDRPVAMVSITTPTENCASESEVSALYGLSPAESRLAVALARGKRLSDIAEQFGVRITTVRTQLSAILKKLAVERQSDIVHLVGSTPFWASRPGSNGAIDGRTAPADDMPEL